MMEIYEVFFVTVEISVYNTAVDGGSIHSTAGCIGPMVDPGPLFGWDQPGSTVIWKRV